MILSIDVPDAIATRVVLALSEQGGYEQGVTVETRAQIAKKRVVALIRQDVRAWEITNKSDAELETIS